MTAAGLALLAVGTLLAGPARKWTFVPRTIRRHLEPPRLPDAFPPADAVNSLRLDYEELIQVLRTRPSPHARPAEHRNLVTLACKARDLELACGGLTSYRHAHAMWEQAHPVLRRFSTKTLQATRRAAEAASLAREVSDAADRLQRDEAVLGEREPLVSMPMTAVPEHLTDIGTHEVQTQLHHYRQAARSIEACLAHYSRLELLSPPSNRIEELQAAQAKVDDVLQRLEDETRRRMLKGQGHTTAAQNLRRTVLASAASLSADAYPAGFFEVLTEPYAFASARASHRSSRGIGPATLASVLQRPVGHLASIVECADGLPEAVADSLERYEAGHAEGVVEWFNLAIAADNWVTLHGPASGVPVNAYLYPPVDGTAGADMDVPHLASINSGAGGEQWGGSDAPQALLVYALVIRLACLLSKSDHEHRLRQLAVNVRISTPGALTRQPTSTIVASVIIPLKDVRAIELATAVAPSLFKRWKGVANNLCDLAPVQPLLRYDPNAMRYVASTASADDAPVRNLASMDWDAFEFLARKVIEREIGGANADISFTASSARYGVEAVGGEGHRKSVAHVKRHIEQVGVSSVSDIYGQMLQAGASEAILLTTARFTQDARSFAAGKPLRLVDGAELLGQLERYGLGTFRIDMRERADR